MKTRGIGTEAKVQDRGHRRASVRAGLLCTTALVAAAGLSLSQASANPKGGVVVGGSAAIRQAPGRIEIDQNSQRAIINWQDFSIGHGEVTRFNQPGQDAIALNRVVGDSASEIFGQLQANGGVWLVNPNGILFGPSAQVDVHSLLATTADISDRDFLDGGRFDFSIASSDPDASVVSQGSISIGEHGLAGLVAPHVRNAGVISGRLGQVVLAGAPTFTLDLYGDGMIQFAATSEVVESLDPDRALVRNDGTINADGGRVLITADAAAGVVDEVINIDGVVEARSFAVEDGAIVLMGGDAGQVTVAGSLDAGGAEPDAAGGGVEVLGDQILLADGARIDASGAAGGGNVYVGGDLRGEGDRPTASQTIVEAGAAIAADATKVGDGGQVVVWADRYLGFAGSAFARGGSEGGNGGFIETSSAGGLLASGQIDASAPAGAPGTWLLDPVNIQIVDFSIDSQPALRPPSFDNLPAQTPSAIVFASDIDSATENVRIEAGESLTVDAEISMLTPGIDLTLAAGENLDVNQTITTDGDLALTAATLTIDEPVTAGGSINLTANQVASGDTLVLPGTITVDASVLAGGDVVAVADNGFAHESGTIASAGGSVTVDAGEGLLAAVDGLGDNLGVDAEISAANSIDLVAQRGSVLINQGGSITAGGPASVSAPDNAVLLLGPVVAEGVDESGVGVRVTAQAGVASLDLDDPDFPDGSGRIEAENGSILIATPGPVLLGAEVTAAEGDITLQAGDFIIDGDVTAEAASAEISVESAVPLVFGPTVEGEAGIDPLTELLLLSADRLSFSASEIEFRVPTDFTAFETTSLVAPTVTQLSAAVVSANTLGILAENVFPGVDVPIGTVTLPEANLVGELAIRDEDGVVEFGNAQDLAVGGLLAVPGADGPTDLTGIEAADVTLRVGGVLTLDQPITADSVVLVAPTVTQLPAGVITASSLGILAENVFPEVEVPIGTVTLPEANLVGELAIRDEDGVVQFGNAQDLVVGEVLAVPGADGPTDLIGITAENVLLQVGGRLTLEEPIMASGGGDAIVTVSEGFTNEVLGESGLQLTSTSPARFLVFSNDPEADIRDPDRDNPGPEDLPPFEKRYNRTFEAFESDPSSLEEEGNLFLYERAPFLVVKADDQSRPFGESNPSFTSTISGFIDGDTQDDAVEGEPSLRTAALFNSPPDEYPIIVGLGTLFSELGYQFDPVNGTLAVTPVFDVGDPPGVELTVPPERVPPVDPTSPLGPPVPPGERDKRPSVAALGQALPRPSPISPPSPRPPQDPTDLLFSNDGNREFWGLGTGIAP